MKKTLLIGSALVIGFAGYSQNNAKKAINPKATQKTLTHIKGVIAEGQSNSHPNINWRPTTPKTTATTCLTGLHVSCSWNPNGVGASEDAMAQNCLTYNKDLNAIAWIMRGSCDWTTVFPTSGGYEATIIQNVGAVPSSTIAPNTIDTIALFKDNSTNLYGGRFPGGSWLNPAGNKDWHRAYACVMGPYNANAAGNWLGALYVAKPLWSHSAAIHTSPSADSLYCVSGSATGPFGPTPIGGTANWFGAPNVDGQQVGNAMFSMGNLLDLSVTTANSQQIKGGYIAKATISSTPGLVNWTIDSTSLRPNFYKGSLGYLVTGTGRLAFGPDGQHGYALYIGRLATTYNNSADSSMTPILFKTIDGGSSWTQVLAGYDWACKHPEVSKNVGMGVLGAQKATYYGFSTGYNGADLTVDANNVLHYVSTVNETFHGQPGTTYSFDSTAIFSYSYEYDNTNYHPIIWDFMTDGTDWKTMMVDSIQSGVCNGQPATDTTTAYSAWTSANSLWLSVGAHLTVSRSADGKKVFYGWADTPAGVTGLVNNNNIPINPNLAPDIWVKGYDVNTNGMTMTTDITPGFGNTFFPYLADISYYDTTQASWVTPAVYTVGRSSSNSSLGFVIYNGNGSTPATGVNYFYTNCGTFNQAAFTYTTASIYAPIAPATSTVCGSAIEASGIENHNNTFASSINNYPNPFNNTTTIAVTLTESKAVDIKVYNTIGGLVFSKKIDGNVGTNNVTFDGGALSSGVYYYTVTAGNQQATKKMIIQK